MRTPAGARTTYSWTYENQLSLIENSDGSRITYTYAPVTRSSDEFRVKTQTAATTTRHFWDRHNIVWETDNAALVTAEYTLSPQPYGALISQRRSGASRFYHFDALGTARALTDSTQTQTDSYFYKAFGELLSSTGSTTNPYQWVGELGYYKDSTSGLYSLRRRDYRSQNGRFTSEDPLRANRREPNLYRYSANTPVNAADPSGLDYWRYDAIPGQPGCYTVWYIETIGWWTWDTTRVGVTFQDNGDDPPTTTVWQDRCFSGCAAEPADVIGQLPKTQQDWNEWFRENCRPVHIDPRQWANASAGASCPTGRCPSQPPASPNADDLGEMLNCEGRGLTPGCFPRALSREKREELIAVLESLREAFSTVVGLCPIIGDLKDIVDALAGGDIITGREFGTLERSTTSIAAALPVIPGHALVWLGKVLADILQELKKCPDPGMQKYIDELEDALKWIDGQIASGAAHFTPTFGPTLKNKIGQKLNQLRKKYPNVRPAKSGGIDDARRIAEARVAQGGGRVGPPVGQGECSAIYFEDGPVTWVFKPNGEFWSMRSNPGWTP